MLTKIMMMEATMANMWIKFQSMTRPSKGRRFLESALEASRMAFKRNVVALFNINVLPPGLLWTLQWRLRRSWWTMLGERWQLCEQCLSQREPDKKEKGFLRFSHFNLKVNPTLDLKLLPSKLEASALCEERWRWLGTCRRQVQTDSGQKYL